jgi:ABC-type branched-subunit amino acid transport system substrate-binding protein
MSRGLASPVTALLKSALVLLLAVCLTVFLLASANQAQVAAPWKIVSWASPLGPQALAYDSLCGLKAMLSFLNANGGVDGRPIEIYSQEMDDGLPDFPARLNTVMQQVQPNLVIGGAANARSGATADYFRRLGLVWFGPWTDQAGGYQAKADDPIGLFPAAGEELDLLLGHAARKLSPGSEILFVYYETGDQRRDVDLALAKGAALGLSVVPLPLSPNFRNWGELESPAAGAGGVVLWLPAGPAAAVVRTIKNRLPEDTVWMTNSMNSPGIEVTEMTGGLWEGMVFPAVLKPKSAVTQSYDAVLNKYGPRGLTLDYQAYLGLAQAQVMVRAMMNAGRAGGSAGLREAFARTSSDGTLLHAPVFRTGPPPTGAAYLAEAASNWTWRPVE